MSHRNKAGAPEHPLLQCGGGQGAERGCSLYGMLLFRRPEMQAGKLKGDARAQERPQNEEGRCRVGEES